MDGLEAYRHRRPGTPAAAAGGAIALEIGSTQGPLVTRR